METNDRIPEELKKAVQRELKPEERVLWSEMPIPTFFTAKNTQLFIFSIVWTLFSVLWTGAASGFSVPDFKDASDPFQLMRVLFPLFGIPFILIGLGMLTIPFFNYRKAWKTIYVITDRRAITFDGGWQRTVRSFPPAKLVNIYRKEKNDGTGDVVISYDEWVDAEGDRKTEDLGFLRIREPKKVEQVLRDLAREGGIDILPQDYVLRDSEHSAGSVQESVLPRGRAGVRLGKLTAVLILSISLGYLSNSSSFENYQKGQNLTFEEYAEGFEDHKARLLDHGPLWYDILLLFFMVGFVIGSYELMGKVIDGALLRISLMRKGQKNLQDQIEVA